MFKHEIESYRVAIREVYDRVNSLVPPKPNKNFTQEALEYVNRMNLLVVGMCSLVEVRLYREAKANEGEIRIEDVRGQGITRLQLYLSRRNLIDFGLLTAWPSFKLVYKIRNAIVHSYGGLVSDDAVANLEDSVSGLQFESLIEANRIRMRPGYLDKVLEIVEKLIAEIDGQVETPEAES